MMRLSFVVYGKPTPQGSKRAFVNKKTGRAQVVDDNGQTLRSWREAVKVAALDAEGERFGREPVALELVFWLPRPKGHYRTGRNRNLLRDAAPEFPASKPDLDKLIRGTCDALTDAGIYTDDASVVRVTASKNYADHARPPGAGITVWAA